MNHHMTPVEEKAATGVTALVPSVLSYLGAAMTEGEARWFFATFCASSMMALCLALMCKKADDTLNLTVGRSFFSTLGGVFVTKLVVHYGKIDIVYNDTVALAGVACGVTFMMFFVGYAFLRIVEAKAPDIAKKWFKKLDV